MSLSDIDIRIEATPANGAQPHMARAILMEIEALLARLAATGRTAAIDLRSTPLAPGDTEFLREQLGKGEVHAVVQVAGPTEISETRYPGVWWVTHKNESGDAVAELIEITPVPALLVAEDADIRASSLELKAALGNGQA